MLSRCHIGLLLTVVALEGVLALPAGIPNQDYSEQEVFTVISEIPSKGHSDWNLPTLEERHESDESEDNPVEPILLDEYLFIYCGYSFDLFDISDPYNPEFVHSRYFSWFPSTGQNADPCGYGATYAYGGLHIVHMDSASLDFVDYSQIDYNSSDSPPIVGSVELPRPIGDGECQDFGFPWGNGLKYPISYAWQPPYLYSAMRGVGIDIIKVDDITDPQHLSRIDGWCDPHNPGAVYAVGNLLIFSDYNGGCRCIVTMDISDPENPVELQHLEDEKAKSWQGFVNGNKYFTAADNVEVWDISDPTNITFERELNRNAGCSGHASSGGVDVQDGYVFFGASCQGVYKWNIETGELAGNTEKYLKPDGDPSQNSHYWDLDYLTVFGNLVIGGSEDHYQGTFLIPHQAEADHTPPAVNMVNPADNAVDQHVKSRVGLTFTDNIDLRSVNSETFKLIKSDGTVIPGKYASTRSIVNFTPDNTLEDNTTYAVCVPSNGISDYVGNTTSEPFVSYFSTGSTAEEFDCNCGETSMRDRSWKGPAPSSVPRVRLSPGAGLKGSARLKDGVALYSIRGRLIGGGSARGAHLPAGVLVSIRSTDTPLPHDD